MSPAAPICITFDNLGEAADLGSRTWSPDMPLGQHFTVGVVDRLLDLLAQLNLPATYFIEAYNACIYPDLLRRFAQAGHEIGCHAWQHETWHRLDPADERELLSRSTGALRELGLNLTGFRPPGGQISVRSEDLLTDLGYRYYSPAGLRAGISRGLAVIPFDWRYIDAFFVAPVFAGLRRSYGAPEDVQSPEKLAEAFTAELRRRVGTGEQMTLLFHPMLLGTEESFAAFRSVLETVAELRDQRSAQPLRMRDLADQMLAEPAGWGAPIIEAATWD